MKVVALTRGDLRGRPRYGSHYFHANTPIDFMSYAQHFGLPTRLLDFTYNPFIALSFAIHGQKSNGNYSCEDDKQYYYIVLPWLKQFEQLIRQMITGTE